MHRHAHMTLFPLLVLALAEVCVAQEDNARPAPRPASMQDTVVQISQTPEMWFYEQERIRYEDPKQAVRRKAELRAAQRSDRLAAQQWFGVSNSRPTVMCTPHMQGFSPYWSSNTYDPNRWRPYSVPTAYVMPVPVRY